ncbi:Aste57867_15287 [Aphanomyces stellatus]|uniref:Aste57867_15287 protein n=1 Tax=Aphanomyces stellatus TaxID=120398 RepID=A0A485L2U3_9STRA|nr:hypothetical protein As57867_015231 [Aphanomyces stellatus]VFT92096.1 Aste57867_15287 [Aphanomyces stellatus]
MFLVATATAPQTNSRFPIGTSMASFSGASSRDSNGPWLIASGPQCMDSLVASSSIAPEERMTFSLWVQEAHRRWCEEPELKPHADRETFAMLAAGKAKRKAWVFVTIVVVLVAAATIFTVNMVMHNKQGTTPTPGSQQPVPTAASSQSWPTSKTAQPVATAATSTTTEMPTPEPTTDDMIKQGALSFVNKCPATINNTVFYTRNFKADTGKWFADLNNIALNQSTSVLLVPGDSFGAYTDANFRLGPTTNATLFAINRNNAHVYYSISTRDGFNVPVQVEPLTLHGVAFGCPTLRCDAVGCETLPAATTATLECPWTQPLKVTFCPPP